MLGEILQVCSVVQAVVGRLCVFFREISLLIALWLDATEEEMRGRVTSHSISSGGRDDGRCVGRVAQWGRVVPAYAASCTA